ncbi:hypothetical protein VPH35_078828 [Triticum aestivum]
MEQSQGPESDRIESLADEANRRGEARKETDATFIHLSIRPVETRHQRHALISQDYTDRRNRGPPSSRASSFFRFDRSSKRGVPMGLQWMLLTCVVGAEAAVAALLTLPAPRAVRAQIVGLTSMLLQPMAAVLPFAAFQLLDIYWKNEHRLICTGEMCTSEERVRFEKSVSELRPYVLEFVGIFLGVSTVWFSKYSSYGGESVTVAVEW